MRRRGQEGCSLFGMTLTHVVLEEYQETNCISDPRQSNKRKGGGGSLPSVSATRAETRQPRLHTRGGSTPESSIHEHMALYNIALLLNLHKHEHSTPKTEEILLPLSFWTVFPLFSKV